MAKQKTLKQSRQEAELLVSELEKEIAKVKKAIKIGLTDLNSAKEVKRDFNKLIPQINNISTKVENSLSSFKTDRDRLKRLLRTVDKFYENKYLPLHNKINNKETGLSKTIVKGRQIERQFNNLKLSHQKQVTEIKKLVTESRQKNNELKRIEAKLRTINSSILDTEKTVNEKRKIITEADVVIEASKNKILKYEKDIQEKANLINQVHKKSEEAFEDITSWHEEASTTLKKIKNIYQIAGNTGLGGEFDKKRTVLRSELQKWEKHIFYSTLLLLLIILGLFLLQLMIVEWEMSNLKFDANFFVRFLITSPLIFYIIFAAKEYNKTKSLLEKYSFKTAIALSIDAHINLLTGIEEFKTNENSVDRIMDFVMSGFNKLYNEPYTDESYRMKLKMAKTELELDKKILTYIDKIKNER
ncbi:coiled-coil domain-containing protein [Pontimicrobium aquaticum]|uniref:Uncharacterized protein n=1 Tax=Pontimicrobium aquaticum TaxID=2565367 RepID=A0A4U0EVS1_9FLAO|nr:hypothetical protein [Pontimicrobium aquaticum]TJY35848.1 hypothetical protein E5167_08230 [Pontimicrobium aquaticum]